jgi:hypothetical protein
VDHSWALGKQMAQLFPGPTARVETGKIEANSFVILGSRGCDPYGFAVVIHTQPNDDDPKTCR